MMATARKLAQDSPAEPRAGLLTRGLPAAHDTERSQSQRLLDQAHEFCVEAQKRGEEVETDQELANEAWAVAGDMAKELGVRARPTY